MLSMACGNADLHRRGVELSASASLTPRTVPFNLANVRQTMNNVAIHTMGVWPAGMAAHRDTALLLMGFAGAHRRSELTALRVGDVTVHPADGLHVRVRSSKTDQEGQGTVRALPYGRDPLTLPALRAGPVAPPAAGLCRR